MAIDRAQYQDYIKERQKEQIRQRAPELRQVTQAAPAMVALTGEKHWDDFLQVIQAKIEDAKKRLESLQNSWVESTTVGHEELLIQSLAAKFMKTRIETLQEVIDTPKQLIEQAKRAQEALDEVADEAE